MRWRIAIAMSLSLMPSAVSSVEAQFKGGEVSASKYGWLSSLQEGRTQSAKTGKPMMVVIRCVP